MKIGLAGLAGAGKDTFAVMLQKELRNLGYKFEIDRYAGLLKEAARQVFGETFDDRDVKEVKVFVTPDLYDRMVDAVDYLDIKLELVLADTNTLWGLFDKHIAPLTWVSPRLFQQLVGTELGRAIDENIWVDYLQNKDGDLIVPDVRFGNETLDYTIQVRGLRPQEYPEHLSEHYAYELLINTDLVSKDIDFIVFNTGTLEYLRGQAKACAEHIMHTKL